MKKDCTSYKTLIKSNITLFVVVFAVLFSYSQKEENKVPLAAQKTNTSIFFTDTNIYLDKDAVFNVQVENVILNKTFLGRGAFSISNTKLTTLKTKEPINVDVAFNNTTVSLESEVKLTKKVTLVNAKLKLNDYDLVTEQEVLADATSKIIENGKGQYLYKTTIKPDSNPLPITNNVHQIVYGIGTDFGVITNISFNSKLKIQTSKLNFISIYIKTPKPPPKWV